MTDLVVGADVGGTATRVGVATVAGEVLSEAVGGPGNPNSVGLSESAGQIRAVLKRALARVPGRVQAVVVGLAGASRAALDPQFLQAAVPSRVQPSVVVLVSDLTVAFCSATPLSRGYVVVAGTGAVAGEVSGVELVQQRDGWGWLLGDDGSAFWIGRAAVRATLTALQQSSTLGPLARDVLETTGTSSYLDLLQSCYLLPPVALARLSLLVAGHADHDPVAAEIVARAAEQLIDLVADLRPRPGVPVVLGGSVLTREGPVRTRFRERLADRPDVCGPGTAVLTASSGVTGALWLGLKSVSDPAPGTHARLTASAARRRREAENRASSQGNTM